MARSPSVKLSDVAHILTGYTNDTLSQFGIVVANPPFSLAKWGADKAANHLFKRGIPPKSKADYAFILHIIETAKLDSGRVAVVVPHGVLFRGAAEAAIRMEMRSHLKNLGPVPK